MSSRIESPPPLAVMRETFHAHYQRAARFKEDAALTGELASEAEPALTALYVALSSSEEPRSLHEAYALLALLARKAAVLAATPSAALTLAHAAVEALRAADVALGAEPAAELAVVCIESYCAARDECVTSELRQIAAAAQVEIALAPRCHALHLAGRHAAAELTPVLEEMARSLLRNEVKSCLLDLSRLLMPDEELMRAIGHFCAQAASLGTALFVVGAAPDLRAAFERWDVHAGAVYVDTFPQGRALAMAAAGFELRRRWRWPRLLLGRGRARASGSW